MGAESIEMSEYVVNSNEILDGYIYNEPWRHCICKIRTIISESTRKEIQGCETLLVLDADEPEESKKKLFHGFVETMTKPVSVFGDIEITVTAYSATIAMDRRQCMYTYQNQSLSQMLEVICGEYNGDSIIASDNVSNSEKGYYLQYNETDWEFLIGILKAAGAEAWADYKSLKPKVYVNDIRDLKSSYMMQIQIYFFDKRIHKTAVGARGSYTIFRSGETETLCEAAGAVYSKNPMIPPGWTMVEHTGLNGVGFCAFTLRRNNNFIIAFRGSSDIMDWKYNIDIPAQLLGLGQQLQEEKYIRRMVARFPDGNIYITGHSLGGHLALEASVYLSKIGSGGRLRRTESFNGFGITSSFDSQKDIDRVKDKLYSREFRADVVSEYGLKIAQRTIYKDKHFDEVLTAINALNIDIINKSIFKAKLAVKTSLENHSIDKFYQLYMERQELTVSARMFIAHRGKVTLLGKVISVNKDKLKVAFFADRVITGEEDFFEFTQSANYKGVHMLPAAGDTVYMDFNRNDFDNSILFQSAVCSKVQRK